MTHLRSDRVTQSKNTFCPRARDGASDIIHAEGVRGEFPSSAPKVRNALKLQAEVSRPDEKIGTGANPHSICRAAKSALARRKIATQLAVVVGHFWRAK